MDHAMPAKHHIAGCFGPGLSTRPSMRDIYKGTETRIYSDKTRQDLEI